MKCSSKARGQYADVGKMTEAVGGAKRCLRFMHLMAAIRWVPLLIEESYRVFA